MTKKLKMGLIIFIALVLTLGTGLLTKQAIAGEEEIITFPDLTFSKTDNKDTANPGDTLTYEISFSYLPDTNNYLFMSVQIVDTLPDHFMVDVTTISDSGTYDPVTRTITWNLGENSNFTPHFSGTIDNPMPNGTTVLTNKAELVQIPFTIIVSEPKILATATDQTTVYQPYCGDGLVNGSDQCDDGASNGNACTADYGQTCTYCSITCTNVTVTGNYCGDGSKNGNEECDDGNTTNGDGCSTECKIVVVKTPAFTITKMDNPDPVAAGSNLTYTLNFTISDADATGVILTDTIPANTSFVSASDPGKYDALTNKVTWNYGDLKMGNYVVILVVKVYSPLANKTVINNTATLTSTEKGELKASSDTTVSTAPILKMEKLVDKASANAGETINYTIKITNSGTDTAHDVKLADTLPNGMTFTDGKNTMTYVFGEIEAGKSVATTYAVKIDSAVSAGAYLNSATLTSTNHSSLTASAKVEVTLPKVLGEETVVTPAPVEEIKVLGAEEELPATGTGILTILFGTILTAAGLYLRKK